MTTNILCFCQYENLDSLSNYRGLYYKGSIPFTGNVIQYYPNGFIKQKGYLINGETSENWMIFLNDSSNSISSFSYTSYKQRIQLSWSKADVLDYFLYSPRDTAREIFEPIFGESIGQIGIKFNENCKRDYLFEEFRMRYITIHYNENDEAENIMVRFGRGKSKTIYIDYKKRKLKVKNK